MKKNTTKRSLALSVLSLVICVAMLLGTTFAWFTDSVTSGVNKIVAGNLDIELEALVGGQWIPVTNTTKLFKEGALWEPGYTEVAYLRLSNKGTLALKYNLAINVANEVAGTNVAGESFKLSDYIKMGVVEGFTAVYADRAEARTAVTAAGNIATYTKADNMLPGDANAKTFAIVVYMPEEVGNEANYMTGTTAPSIELGVSVVATQLASESDSFGSDYDAEAIPGIKIADGLYQSEVDANAYTVTNANGLAKFNELYNTTSMGAVSLELAADIDMAGKTWTPIASLVSGEITPSNKITKINGNGFKIKNLMIGEHSVAKNANGMILAVANDLTVKNIVIEAPKMNTTKNNVGIIVGQVLGGTTTLDNVIVNNADITAKKKIGTLVGIVTDDDPATTSEKVVINNCSVAGSKFNNTDTEDSYTGTLVGWVADTLYGAKIEVNGTCNVSPAAVTYPESCTTIKNAKLYMHSYNPYVCVDELENVKLPVATTEELAQAIANAESGDTIIISSATGSVAITSQSKHLKFVGDGKTEMKLQNSANFPNGAEFENLVFNAGNVNYTGLQHSGKIVLNNCKVTGEYQTYSDTDFIGCTFENASGYCLKVYGGSNILLDGCVFNGNKKCVYVYQESLDGDKNVTVKNTKFNFSNPTTTDNKSAVMLNAPVNWSSHVYNLVIDDKSTVTNGNNGGTAVETGIDYRGIYGLKHLDGNGNPLTIVGSVKVGNDTVYKYPAE